MATQPNRPKSGTSEKNPGQQRAGEKSSARQQRDQEGQVAGKKSDGDGKSSSRAAEEADEEE